MIERTITTCGPHVIRHIDLLSYPTLTQAPDQSAVFRMSYRFFHPHAPVDNRFTLVGDQAHHAINVMRNRAGDRIVIFDGQGTEHDAEIESLTKKQLTASLLETRRVGRSLSRAISIVVALPKGDRQKFLVEKLVELGVTKLIPLATSRSVAEVKPKVIERIEKQIIEASKQCGRNYLMQIGNPVSVTELCQGKSALAEDQYGSATNALRSSPGSGNIVKLLAHPYNAQPLSDVHLEPHQSVAIAIGPEGGFSDEEVKALIEADWKATQLGSSILRIETAAIAAATMLGIGMP